MAIKEIIEKIKQDALSQAGQLKEKNDKEVAVVSAKGKEAIKAIEDETARLTREKYDEEKRLKVSFASLELKNKLLTAKHQLMDDAFNKALSEIKAMPPDQYKKLLISLVLKAEAQGTEEIALGADDYAKFGATLVDEINAAFTKAGKKGSFKQASERRENIAGCVLKDGRKETICTFESIISDKRKELEKEAALILFKE